MPKAQRQKLSRSKPTDKTQKTATPADGPKSVLNKTTKQKQRHEAWLEKLDHSYATKKKQQKKAKQGALTKGFDDFGDVLQMIQKETPTTSTTTTTNQPASAGSHIISSKKIKGGKAKKKAMMQEMARFQKVLQHDAFKQDPLSTIKQHVQNSFQ
ncbi:ribosome biogenesis protein SLX9-domain-containing protein [Chlamydoabsidia padenii]|nr:ribosome biogenesis protein SLX9-domain-containing protein [Chlamydoabsidia padenii]